MLRRLFSRTAARWALFLLMLPAWAGAAMTFGCTESSRPREFVPFSPLFPPGAGRCSADGRVFINQILDENRKIAGVQVWNLADRRPLAILRGGHNGTIMGVALSPDGTTAATASLDGSARVWDLASARELRSLPAPDYPVRFVAFSRDKL